MDLPESIWLDPSECMAAELVALARHLTHLTDANTFGLRGKYEVGRDEHARGMLAQAAVAKLLNRWPHYLVDTPDKLRPSVGNLYSVKTTVYRNGSLLVHKEDSPDLLFILVRPAPPSAPMNQSGFREFLVGGWMSGEEAQARGEWREYRPGGGAFWMKPEDLYPMDTLPPDTGPVTERLSSDDSDTADKA